MSAERKQYANRIPSGSPEVSRTAAPIRKIGATGDDIFTYVDEKGVLNIGIRQFLLGENSLDTKSKFHVHPEFDRYRHQPKHMIDRSFPYRID